MCSKVCFLLEEKQGKWNHFAVQSHDGCAWSEVIETGQACGRDRKIGLVSGILDVRWGKYKIPHSNPSN